MQKSFNKSPRCQSLNLLQQQNKYWANNDEVKLADTTGFEAPIDLFKTTYHPKKSKFFISNKVTEENHWKFSNKICDPEIKKGWRASIKWSENEKDYKC